jgi:hypothetical protein
MAMAAVARAAVARERRWVAGPAAVRRRQGLRRWMVTTAAGEVVVTGEVAARPAVARPAVASAVTASAARARADEVRAVGTAAAGLATAATVPVSMVAARQRWQGRQWRR